MADQNVNNSAKIKPDKDIFMVWVKKYRFFILFGGILLVGTLLLKFNDGQLDKAITSLFYDDSLPLGSRFYLENVQPWLFLNDFNKIFEYFLYVTLIPMMIIGAIKYKELGYLLRYGLYAFLSAVTGVLIFVNMIFKDFYGRPRPRQTNLWPNSETADMWEFYSVWEPAFLKDPSLIDAGKSFPSGHVAIVVVFIIFFFMFMHPEFWAEKIQRGKTEVKMRFFTILKWTGLAISVILGILTGIGRIVVGAHHASDVLWSFGMVYIMNAVFYYWIFRFPQYEKEFEVRK